MSTTPTVRVPLTPMATLRWSVVREELDRLPRGDVLEVGCGQGGYGALLAARGGSYLGVEPDAQSCAVARERVGPLGGTVLKGTTDDVPARPDFDLLCAFEVIEHIEDDGGALRDWVTRLRPGGAVVVSVPAWPSRFSPMDELVGHFRRYTPEDLRGTLADAGLVDVRTRLYGWPLGFALESVRNRIAERRRASGADPGAGGHEDAMATRSAASGRLFQPRAAAGAIVRVGVSPFTRVQRLRPTSGTGLVGVGRVPA